MDKIAKKEILKFYEEYKNILKTGPIADMGAYNINGSVKNILTNIKVVGFDILEGKGVDVCIEPGQIPEEHKYKYPAVTVCQSFQFCPETQLYKKQICDILKPNGLLLLIVCTPKCKIGRHSSSPNKIWEKGLYINWAKEQIINFFSDSFKMIDCYDSIPKKGHPSCIYKGKKYGK